MVKDMTAGNPVKLILFFSIPLLLGNLFQQFYNMVDAMVVGRFVGVGALAAVGATGSMMFTIIGFAMGLTLGFSVIVSQRFGAGDEEGVKRAFAMSILLSGIITAFLMIAGTLLCKPLLLLMNTPEDIMKDSQTYLGLIFLGAAAPIYYNLISSMLRALGDSKTPLYFLILSSIINVGLDLLFVISFHMGVAGVAVATIISQIVSCILCLVYMKKKHPILTLSRRHWKWDPEMVRQLVKMGLPTAFQNSVTGIGIMMLQTVVNGFGSTIVAAYTAASKVQQLSTQPLMSFGMAMATYVGQNLGAGKLQRIQKGVKDSIWIILVTSVLGYALIFFGAQPLVQMFVSQSQTEVIEQASMYLKVTSLFYFVLGMLFVYRSSLQGLGNAIIPMISGFLELVLRVSLAFILPNFFGFQGVAMADVAAWIGAGVLLMIFYYKNVRVLTESPRV
ncbi:MAG: MATE family efflux transporter [Massiliimalia sp.]